MTNTRKKQIKTLGILLVAVIGLTLGFAAFSSSLNIKTRLSVNPNNGTFLVKFSNKSDKLDESDVVPTKSSDIFTAYNGEIDNSGIPTISNLGGQFTQPGETITYDFYTLNTGEYKAYLTDVIFNNVDGETVNKKCTSVTGENQSEVDEACKSISIRVVMGIDTIMGTRSLTGHSLAKNESEAVKVVITYASGGVLPDVEFDVEFGNISMIYNSLEESDIPGGGEQNVWQQRGLTSSKVVYDYAYVNNELNDVVMGLYSDGAFIAGEIIKSDEVDSLIEHNELVIGEDYFIVGMGSGYVAYVFEDNTTLKIYFTGDSNISFTKDSIISNAEAYYDLEITNTPLPTETSSSSSSYTPEEPSPSPSPTPSPTPTVGFSTCTLSNDQGTSGISEGDKITCGSESFYVIADPSNSTVKMLAEYLLNTSSGYQSEYYSDVVFYSTKDDYAYWTDGTKDSLNSNFTACTGNNCYEMSSIQYPVDVYGISNSTTGETSDVETYVNSYVSAMNTALGTSATGRLITYDELLSLGCTGYSNGTSCTNAPSWVYNLYYWTGSAWNDYAIWQVESFGGFSGSSFSNTSGVRPVIEVSQSAIQTS